MARLPFCSRSKQDSDLSGVDMARSSHRAVISSVFISLNLIFNEVRREDQEVPVFPGSSFPQAFLKGRRLRSTHDSS